MQPSIRFPVIGGFTMIDEADLPLVAPFRWRLQGPPDYQYVGRWQGSRGGGAKRQIVFMHRVIADAPPGVEVDHRNGNRLDNRRANLRICTHAQNMQNRRPNRGARSRFKGVHWDAYRRTMGFWRVEIRANGRRIYVGRFDDELEAAHAHDEAALRYHGAFASLNFPTDT